MAKKFPQDEFDLVERPGGAHRGSVRAADRLIGFTKYLASVVALSGTGILALNLFSASTEVDTSVDISPTTSVQAETFKGDGLGVTVIDATSKKGLAMKVAQGLLDKGWNVYGAADAGLASGGSNFKKTTVYYSTEAAKDAASKVLADLGSYDLKQSAFFSDPITIVLAKDYK